MARPLFGFRLVLEAQSQLLKHRKVCSELSKVLQFIVACRLWAGLVMQNELREAREDGSTGGEELCEREMHRRTASERLGIARSELQSVQR